jgi:hypothetical protein
MGDPIGITMMVGMACSAVFNAAMAGSLDYDEKCKHVDEINKSIQGPLDWTNQVEAKFQKLDFDIEDEISTLQKQLAVVKQTVINEKQRQQKILHREEIIGTILCSMVSLLLLIKLISRHL